MEAFLNRVLPIVGSFPFTHACGGCLLFFTRTKLSKSTDIWSGPALYVTINEL